MTTQISLSKLEKSYAPDFRNKVGAARNTNDVYHVFCHTVALMFNELTEGDKFREDDIDFYPERECHYEFGSIVKSSPLIQEYLQTSDLKRILDDMAHTAANRHTHLENEPKKINAKLMHR
ncbi:hypothetical protein [Photobacterium atrarenae]|uniref:Uncharacterized protein n=1 Tax=Photobacterium atrarenae TaxID=865757 RepID=A0ABY5GLD0_9GAMM|nr:hypothetical protein [Photobacterium atrarenae]UTV30125.1 hypothetical protein NNL38_16190 [Photobacterium atrarenae]